MNNEASGYLFEELANYGGKLIFVFFFWLT